eukprot:5312954-Amphidinium_carterae.1
MDNCCPQLWCHTPESTLRAMCAPPSCIAIYRMGSEPNTMASRMPQACQCDCAPTGARIQE